MAATRKKTVEELLSPREAAKLLGLSLKATQQHLARGAFPNAERELNPETGRVNRVWIPIANVRAFAERRRIPLPEQIDPLTLRQPPNGGLPTQSVQEVIEILDRMEKSLEASHKSTKQLLAAINANTKATNDLLRRS